jgi:hypothetical protein
MKDESANANPTQYPTSRQVKVKGVARGRDREGASRQALGPTTTFFYYIVLVPCFFFYYCFGYIILIVDVIILIISSP